MTLPSIIFAMNNLKILFVWVVSIVFLFIKKLTPKTWTRTLKILDPEKPGPRKTWTQKNLELEKPGPRKIWTRKNRDSEKPGPWKIWTLEILDYEKGGKQLDAADHMV